MNRFLCRKRFLLRHFAYATLVNRNNIILNTESIDIMFVLKKKNLVGFWLNVVLKGHRFLSAITDPFHQR